VPWIRTLRVPIYIRMCRYATFRDWKSGRSNARNGCHYRRLGAVIALVRAYSLWALGERK